MSRGNAIRFGAAVCCFLLLGCQQNTQKEAAAPSQTAKAGPQTPLPPGPAAGETAAATTRPAPLSEPKEPIVGTEKPLPKESYAPASGQQPRVHVVQAKETLRDIAKHYYNDPNKWRRIYEANRQRIPQPDKIRAGMKLIIP